MILGKLQRISIGLFAIGLCFLSSCNNYSYRQIISSYAESTNELTLHKYFVSVPVAIGNLEWPEERNMAEVKGVIVCRALVLYNFLYKDSCSESSFSDHLLAMLVKDETLVLTQQQYDSIEQFTISPSDANKLRRTKLSRLNAQQVKAHFLKNISRPDVPDYRDRCIIYGFLVKGRTVFIEHESGYLQTF